MMETIYVGPNWRAVHRDSPPRILIRQGKSIVGYIDVRTGQKIVATKEELIALGVSPAMVQDAEVAKL